MRRIDAHQHFWKFDPERDSWITDEMKVLQRDFEPDDLQLLLKEHNIHGCVAVQSVQDEKDNFFLLELSAGNPFIEGIVGWVDLQSEIIDDRLQYFKQFPKIKGFRHVLQAEDDDQFMLRPAFRRGISSLAQYGFTYDILVYPRHLRYVKQLVGEFPDQQFVLDHLAKPNVKDQALRHWERDLREVARHPNVFCKVSGMITEADWSLWRIQDFEPYLDVVFDAFGIERLMYGSDWPVCLLAGEYGQTVNIVKHYTESLSVREQELFWGRNAIDFYSL